MEMPDSRIAEYPVDRIFLDRWSPRAFTGEVIPHETLFTILEAARWAPSSYNSQPWRFLYATRDSADWPMFIGLLNEFNQSWAAAGSALLFIISDSKVSIPGKDERVPSYSHSFDSGAAWCSLSLQALMLGWYAHAMGGINFERIKEDLKVPVDHRVEAGVVIGRLGSKASLPDFMQVREAPSARKPLADIIFEGSF